MEEQRMADLPPEHVEASPPFTFCRMDCFGPFLPKQGKNENRIYGLLFTCLSSRAVHIEMLDDMCTDALINGLRCFIAIRGAVCQNKSDQGSNFVGAKNELKEALKEVDTDQLAASLSEKQCDFLHECNSFKPCWRGLEKTNKDSEKRPKVHTCSFLW